MLIKLPVKTPTSQEMFTFYRSSDFLQNDETGNHPKMLLRQLRNLYIREIGWYLLKRDQLWIFHLDLYSLWAVTCLNHNVGVLLSRNRKEMS
jgi:hypothetical protein